eukprot:snap_masked-scaffold_1-processed-gene-0.24-mRNA-1 protein AED:1.00 eAED:1.00 QI:0/0/0/0/1/1/2/0/148
MMERVTRMGIMCSYIRRNELDWVARDGYEFFLIIKDGFEKVKEKVDSWKEENKYPENRNGSSESKKFMRQALKLMVQRDYKERISPKKLLMEEPFKEWAASWAGKGDKVAYFFENAQVPISSCAKSFWTLKHKPKSQDFVASHFMNTN